MRFVFIPILLYLVACSSTPIMSSGAPQFAWPVKGGRITQKFKSLSKRHDGIDIAAQKNTPVYASESGRVIYAGHDFTGYGKLIIIEHRGDAWATFYAHLNSFDIRQGDSVYRGQKIASMGKTGRASGVHLHFEIRRDLRPVNPLHFLGPSIYLSER